MRVLAPISGLLAFALAPLASTAFAAQVEVDANLITALDASSSVGGYEERIEREGLAHAVVHSRFLDAVRAGPHKRVGFAVFTWSSHGHTKMLVPWTIIATPEDAARISRHLLSIDLIEEYQLLDRDLPTAHYEASTREHLTDIAQAIRSGTAHLGSAPFTSRRAVINIVGNGPSNSGREPATARDGALDAAQVVNGLVVGQGLARDIEYYRTHVIGGPGSLVMQVSNPQEMTEAFVAKLRLDIAGLSKATASDGRFLTAYGMANPSD
jgi:Ca-activated chloride channel family protein